MTTAIFCTTVLSMSPYVWFYADICKQNGIDYIIITKANESIEIDGYNILTYVVTAKMMKENRVKRTIDWLKWVKHTINERKVSNIVITPTNTAFVLAPILLMSRYRYLLDIRDYTKENSFLFRQLEKAIIKKAKLVVISSKGFLRWMPKTNTPIYVVHNMPLNADRLIKDDYNRASDEKTVIGYIGYVNYYTINKRLIDILKGSNQYSLRYCGKIAESCLLEKYVAENKIHNVEFTGPFSNNEKAKLYRTIDMINSIYGNDSFLVTTSLPNKLYDAAIYKKPILAAKGTFLGETIEKYNLGLAVDVFHDDLLLLLNDYWQQFDRDRFEECCELFFADVTTEQEKTVDKIIDFIRVNDR